jgi:hypothetical protein
MDRDTGDVGGKDFVFGATGLGLCAVIAIILMIVS